MGERQRRRNERGVRIGFGRRGRSVETDVDSEESVAPDLVAEDRHIEDAGSDGDAHLFVECDDVARVGARKKIKSNRRSISARPDEDAARAVRQRIVAVRFHADAVAVDVERPARSKMPLSVLPEMTQS